MNLNVQVALGRIFSLCYVSIRRGQVGRNEAKPPVVTAQEVSPCSDASVTACYLLEADLRVCGTSELEIMVTAAFLR